MSMFEIGDTFIRYSKYGGFCIGVVKEICKFTGIDLRAGVNYSIVEIVSMNGVRYRIDGLDGKIYKVTKQFENWTPERRKEISDVLRSKLKKDV